MDMTQNFQNLSIDDRRKIYNEYFTLSPTTSNVVENKLELLNLISFLTFQLKKREPDKYKSALDVMQLFKQTELDDTILYDRYLIGLSIICDNLLESVKEFPNNTGCKTAKDVMTKINNLLFEWIPF